MTTADIPQVMDIERESFPSMWPQTAYSRELRNRLARYFVLVEEGEDGEGESKPTTSLVRRALRWLLAGEGGAAADTPADNRAGRRVADGRPGARGDDCGAGGVSAAGRGRTAAAGGDGGRLRREHGVGDAGVPARQRAGPRPLREVRLPERRRATALLHGHERGRCDYDDAAFEVEVVSREVRAFEGADPRRIRASGTCFRIRSRRRITPDGCGR